MDSIKFLLLVVLLELPSLSSGCTETYSKSRTTNTCTRNWYGKRRCSGKTVYYTASRCCAGWGGDGCNYPLCNGLVDPHGCSQAEGRVEERSGRVWTTSGGTCVRPNVCENCNPGYYASGSYCKACTTISNCLYPSCSKPYSSVCNYCEGEVKEQYGWYAYTRFLPGDAHKRCRRACSWRSGSRCYPGTCSDTTTDSCQCIEGLTGSDCDTITEDPHIPQNFLRLTETTATSVNHIEAPPDSGSGSPQDVVWTNIGDVEEFSAHVDASYKKDLPTPPAESYVNPDATKIGIINGGIKLEWMRGSTQVANSLTKTCETDPIPSDYRCQYDGNFNTNNWQTPFIHGDILKFTVFATNGGYVSIYNRENGNNVDKYTINGRTKTNVFQIGFDMESPAHCIMENPDCSSKPLSLQDTTIEASAIIEWAGWEDMPSGIQSYHFEVFHLKSTGAGGDSDLIHGEKVQDAVAASVLADVSQTTVTFPSVGPYAVTITAYDNAGNHKTARRLTIFDDNSYVTLQGSRSTKADVDGSCKWISSPSPPIVKQADPVANCNWITKPTSVINIVWNKRFINTQHHARQWLNSVRSMANIDQKLDDNDGVRTTLKVNNVLGITDFQIAYNVTFEEQTTSYSFENVNDIQSESFSVDLQVNDGMKLDAQIRAVDIIGTFADDFIEVKVDTSSPVIEDLWLTKGDRVNISVHNTEDLSKLQIEWKAYDIHSGIGEIYWRIFDNYTGNDFDHGTAYMSPQGGAETHDSCTDLYGDYPKGADCYCTPYDGCFHQQFHVIPQIHDDGTNGLQESKHMGVHDSDYFIEVTATNKAMLKTTKIVKITIDTSSPVAGFVHEGVRGEPEVDFQQDKIVMVHWSDFFDKESGIMFYRYGYGVECLESDDFDLSSGKDLHETYLTEAWFEVENERKYYVTVAAYNHALDHSEPVCSDGVVIDTSIPSISELHVAGARVDPQLLRDKDENIWFLHDDRTRQRVENVSYTCRSTLKPFGDEELQVIPLRRNYIGQAENIAFHDEDDCSNYIVDAGEVITVIHNWKYLEMSWKTSTSAMNVYDFEIGLSSTLSKIPDIMEFKSANHHTRLTISHPNIDEGSVFYFVVKSVSRSGVENIQIIGPFLLITSPPDFDGEITVTAYNENYLVASWNASSLHDIHNVMKLDFQFAIGTRKYATDVHPYSNLNFFGNCESTNPPTCTALSLDDLDWDLHHGKEYYISIRVNDTAGLVARISSKPYKHEVLAPSAGVVIDTDPRQLDVVSDNDDIDYQKSTAEMTARWYGFDHFYAPIRYTACIMDANDVILPDTCKYVGRDRTAILSGTQLTPFQKYKVLVKAETETATTSALSDGVIVIDDKANLNDILVFDGESCPGDTVILLKDKTHHDNNISYPCTNAQTYQASAQKLSAYWVIPEEWKTFIPDLYWHIEERAPVVEYWKSKTDETHISSSASKISINFPLVPGRTYRFGLTFCAVDICYNTMYTSGITVIPSSPRPGQLSVSYNSDAKRIDVIFEKFLDEDIEDLTEAQEVIDFYEWNIADNDVRGRVTQKWIRLENSSAVNETHMEFKTILRDDIKFTKCWNFLLRGTNKVGSSAIVAKNIKPCDDLDHVQPATIIDCVVLPKNSNNSHTSFDGSPIELGVNDRWMEDDKDYTPYNNILSAVWTGLRFTRYEWAVIEIHSNDPVLYYFESPSLRKPCDSPETISCGTTDKNYVNVFFDAEPLLNGHRYAICIHADSEVLAHEYWNEELPEISTCSDGVTVDATPPQPGDVWINRKDALYQTSKSEVAIYWEKFLDIEEIGKHAHESGMSYYEVALGSFFGGADVVPLTNVGIVNHVTFHDLKLQDGHSYFATVKGFDFTGRFSSTTSAPVIIDTTPPEKSNKEITIEKKFITELSYIEACWTGIFNDPESGMAYYKWAVGSRPGYDDKYAFSETSDTCSEIKYGQSLTLEEGHMYFITVMDFNNAGLFSTASSWGFTVDTSPPVRGYVNDGKRKPDGSAKDIDYQTERSELSVHWGGFSDPHTPIKEFILSIGTTRGGTDVINAQSVGVVNDIIVDHLQLREGSTYYVAITACNMAGLCASEVSDGVLVDSSHPVPGKVIDGTGNKDIRYQASRNYVGTKWFGFNDPQSGLSHFTWRAGTVPLADDIIPAREVHLHEIAVIPDLIRQMNIKLPVNKMIYNTIRAYNKAGLYSESVSNGFIVDDSAPVFTKPLQHVPIGSLLSSTSVLRSSLKVKWDVADPGSYINGQYLSISAHRGDDFNETVQIGGFVKDYTFTNLEFHDGSIYSVKLTACNGAKLCSSSVLPDLLVDTSPPTAGTFAIHTDHAVSRKLNRQPENWMTWEPNQINLAWLGFSDIHSGILEYHINIGSSFMADDVNEHSGEPYIIAHKAFDQEDGVQINAMATRALLDYEHVFISILAVNRVGLKSDIVHSQFRLVPGGSVQLIRRCNSHTCQGHCVCAAHDLKCTPGVEKQDCIDKTGDAAYAVVEVEDLIYLSGDVEDSFEGTHVPTDMMLSAKWSLKSGNPPSWYEWSVGLSEYDSPMGIFDSHARVWHDAGQLLSWTFTVPKGSKLQEGQQYSFFVQAWFNSNTVSAFKSRGVIIQTRAPETTFLFGKTVKEVRVDSDKDVDYIKSSERLSAMWDGKFKNAETAISKFIIFISSEPNGHDIHISNEAIPPYTTRYNLTGLYPDTGTRFYTNVIAYNQAGLYTVATSDGCKIDADKPVAGVVYDGKGFLDINYQNTSVIVSASWQGFVDLESSLRSYHWCVSPADYVGSCSVLFGESIRLVNRAERKLPSAVPNGVKIVSEIYATDLVGHTSDTVVSDGVVIDKTPPVRQYHLSFGDNLLTNPSFEDISTSVTIEELNLTHSCPYDSPQYWLLAKDSCGITVTATADHVQNGATFLVLKGTISQTVTGINRESVYSLTFYTSHVATEDSSKSNSEGFVSFNGEKHVIVLHSKPNRSDHKYVQMSWQYNSFTFRPKDSEIKIEIGAFENSVGIAIDNVELKESISTNDNGNNAEGHVRAHTVFLHDWSSLHASWNFIDDESGIQEYLWAIGTVQGGTQLQDFKSVGTRLFDTNHNLYLPHNITIHISVVAVNGAGLRTISYSGPVRVDLTPPVFEYVNDGTDEGVDVDYQKSLTVGVNFKVSDPESGIGRCSWGIGTQPGDISIKQFENIPSGQYSSEKQLQEQTSVTKIFVVVRCENEAGLVSTMSSDGVAILNDNPTAGNIVVEVLGKSSSQYLAHSYYHGTRDSLRIRWTANEEGDWIQKYKVAVTGPSHAITSYVHEYSPGYIYATFLDLPLEDGLYNISVTGIDHLNTESYTISTSVTVLTEQPKIKGDIQISWNNSREEVTVTWSDVFHSTSPLYYEVSAGTVKGGGDIIQWQETRNTELIFKLARNDIGQYGNTLYAVVRAITLSGTYSTTKKEQLITLDD